MKYTFLGLISILLFSCTSTKTSSDVEGFKLGKKLSYKIIQSKLGNDNTLEKIFKAGNDPNLVATLFEEDTWDYIFPNGKKGFISFFTDSSNNLVRVWVQMGTLKKEFSSPNNPRTLWKIIQNGEKSDVEYIKKYLSKKYGHFSDSVKSGNFNEFIWKLRNFEVELNFLEGDSFKISILYFMTPGYMHIATSAGLKSKEPATGPGF